MLRDKDIREPLFDFLETVYGKIRIIEEKTMGRSRADAVMVTEEALFGIEIKSDADSYERLSRQVKDYNKFFDYNYVVVGSSHAHHIGEHVPPAWGIITVEQEARGRVDFYVLRQPQPNLKRDLKKQLGLLWKPELARILARNQMPKYAGKSKAFIAGKLTEKVEAALLSRQISEELFERDYTVYDK